MTAPLTDISGTLRARLADLEPLVFDLHDDSAAHVGHAGAASGAGHFSLTIVSEAFGGLPRLKRHRTVMARIVDLIPFPIHALSIRAFTPEEYS